MKGFNMVLYHELHPNGQMAYTDSATRVSDYHPRETGLEHIYYKTNAVRIYKTSNRANIILAICEIQVFAGRFISLLVSLLCTHCEPGSKW